tara:strand:+ start:76491 stop:77318 length:828 start_codon:yes stop_codon:yes gene_type:complete
MQSKRTNTSITNKENLSLSIQFSLDGFSFSIHQNASSEAVYFGQYLFDEPVSEPEELLAKIEPLFKADKELHYDFNSIDVYYKNDLYTLVPDQFFDEQKLSTYLDYSVKTFSTDLCAFDQVSAIQANLVYIPYVNINNFLFQNFGEFEFHHYMSLFLPKVLDINPENGIGMYVDFGKRLMNLAVINGKQVSLCNSFQYTTPEDCLYYLLFTAEQLNIDNLELNLNICGSIDKDSAVFKLIEKYVKNVVFVDTKNSVLQNTPIAKHQEFALLHSCE